MSPKSKMSPEAKAVLKWSGVTLEELADELELDEDVIQREMDDPSQRAHLISSINSIQQAREWGATYGRMLDLINNLPDEFDSYHRDALGEIFVYISNHRDARGEIFIDISNHRMKD